MQKMLNLHDWNCTEIYVYMCKILIKKQKNKTFLHEEMLKFK